MQKFKLLANNTRSIDSYEGPHQFPKARSWTAVYNTQITMNWIKIILQYVHLYLLFIPFNALKIYLQWRLAAHDNVNANSEGKYSYFIHFFTPNAMSCISHRAII